MPKNSFLSALFTGPKFSIAPVEHNNRGAAKIGEVFPVFATVLNPRESIQIDMGHLVRFMPAKAPVMEGYKVTFDAFAVPYSALGYAERKERDIDDFFNIKENGGEVSNPFCFRDLDVAGQLCLGSMLIKGSPNRDDPNYVAPSLANAYALGNLCDYLNFPSLKNVRDHVRKWLQVNPLAYGSRLGDFVTFGDSVSQLSRDAWSFVTLAFINRLYGSANTGFYLNYASYLDALEGAEYVAEARFGLPFSVEDNPVVGSADDPSDVLFSNYTDVDDYIGFVGVHSLLGFILDNYPAVAAYYHFSDFDFSQVNSFGLWVNKVRALLSDNNPISLDYLQVLYDNYGIDAQSIYNEYFEYVMSFVLYNSSLLNSDTDPLWASQFLPTLGKADLVDLSYLAAYWKIISDWYINTNIDGDPEDFFLEHCRLLTDASEDGAPSGYLDRYVCVTPFRRRWANDVFTSSVPAAQTQNVRIPVDGTIPDLREANAYQKLVDIFRNTGRRLLDVIYGVFGITPSAVRSEMSEPIGTRTSWIGMQSILQTSQTTPESPQAAYAGIGTDSQGHGRLFKYVNNDEPTPVIVMVLMSVTQRASYMQGFDRKFFRKSIYDFAIPQLAMIGEQEVTNKELYFDKDYTGGTFGFNRRYYDWFYMPSEVHSDLRDSMDYWHGARIFDEQPALNSEFIGIDSAADHLQRVFANVSESANPIVYNLSFEGYKTVALPRYIQYEL